MANLFYYDILFHSEDMTIMNGTLKSLNNTSIKDKKKM